jgi:hypothetical protein
VTEQEWLTTVEHPRDMLEFLERNCSLRKWRLYPVACYRKVWDKLPSKDVKCLFEVVERYADGNATDEDLQNVGGSARRLDLDLDVALYAAESVETWVDGGYELSCDILRDIFGNPFRPVTVNSAWLTATVVSLAQAIYDERAYDRLPILADALEDAGCDNAEILNHCRQPGEHVRGCFVVDLLLGKR